MFPAGEVPDGSVFFPHHYSWGLLGAILVLGVIWDNYRFREPVFAMGAIFTGLFAFLMIWPTYHVVGALLALLAPLYVCLSLLYRIVAQTTIAVRLGLRDDPLYSWVTLLIGLLFALVALDDAVEHAFHVVTPFEWAWSEIVYPALPST